MSIRRRHRCLFAAVASLGMCACLGPAAHAAPPLTAPLAPSTEVKVPAIAAGRNPQGRLDLAAPALPASAFERQAAADFAGALPRRAAGMLPAGTSGRGAASAGRIMSGPEMLARKFKREGLPVARLFQSENALVHVGLSPKGKPGLWFVEKLH